MSTDDPTSDSTLLVQLQNPVGSWVDVGLLKSSMANNWFEFVPHYWELADRPVLGQVFEEHGRGWKPKAHVALPRWFSHLLPEGRLRDAVSRAAGVNSVREFELLRRLGPTDLQGAVRAIPALVEGLSYETPPAMLDEVEGDDNPLLKFSLAGTQLKYSVYADDRGLTVPARGVAGNVIAKLPDGRVGFEGVPEAEYAALQLARRAGFDAAEARLVQIFEVAGLETWVDWVGNRKVLAVERFDRYKDDRRVHMEELAQVIDIPTARENAKYRYANFEMVANYVAALSGIESVGVVIDRIVLNALIGNGDAHLKNWAFRYPDGRNPTLSPLYDVVPTVLFIANDNMGLNLNDSKRFEDVTEKSFDRIGSITEFGVSQARQRARLAVQRVLDNWQVLADELLPDHYRRLKERLSTLPLARK